MNLTDQKYSKFALVQEMMDTVGVVKKFDINQTKDIAKKILIQYERGYEISASCN